VQIHRFYIITEFICIVSFLCNSFFISPKINKRMM